MKHSLTLKFIAVLLCALSLTGCLISGLGLAVMLEGDLFDKTVDEVLDNRGWNEGGFYAYGLARQYASEVLGGCPPELVAYTSADNGFANQYLPGAFGYGILDENGQLLRSEYPDLKNKKAKVYSFPVTGDYVHLLSEEPVEAVKPDITVDTREDVDDFGMTALVFEITVSTPEGSSGISSPEPLGMLSRESDGRIIFTQSGSSEQLHFGCQNLTGVTFRDREERVLFRITGEETVAWINLDGYGLETIIIGEAPQQEPVQILQATPVYQAIFYGSDGKTVVETLSGTQPIGSASVDGDGKLVFQLYIHSSQLTDTSGVFSVVLMDQQGQVLFVSSSPQRTAVIGTVVGTEDGITFYESSAALEEAVDMDQTLPVEAMPQEGATLPQEETLPPESNQSAENTPEEETLPAGETPDVQPLIGGKPLEEYPIQETVYYGGSEPMLARYVLPPLPAYTVELYILPGGERYAGVVSLLRLLHQNRNQLIPLLLGSMLLFAIGCVYLCAAAGCKEKNGPVHAGGLNCLPLDLYLGLTGMGIVGLIGLVMVCWNRVTVRLLITLLLSTGFAGCLLLVGFLFACVAQGKTPGGYWWRNSVTGRILRLWGRGMLWLVKKFCPWLWKLLEKLWAVAWLLLHKLWSLATGILKGVLGLIHNGILWFWKTLGRWIALLPLTWQWILAGMLLLLTGALAFANRRDGWGVLWLLAGLAVVLYVSRCFGLLLESTKRMGKGNLDVKVDDKLMVGCFEEFAGDLNALADVAVVAARNQLKSERMKTELITNVSHDIKTPLTSIINYADLLQKPHTEAEQKTYLEVLSRQSLRLKKLIEDLIEMSKASTGNMSVDMIRLDVVESVNQALGEFDDKLARAQLTPIFRHEEPSAWVMADGRLLWRVLSNLLSNAVKYAMPGTRLYIDLMCLDGQVILSLKNISRDELNTDAQELMERFVRGDDSRNTEGSGLGLNIAKSLTELQKGQLQLVVDGDLFKVILTFPSAE